MQNFNVKPFTKNEFIEELRKKFPQYKIQTSLGALQVRKSGFTLTGNVKIDTNPDTGKITTTTQLDSMPFLIIMLPIGLYVWFKKQKIKDFEEEVIEGIKAMMN